MYVLIFPKLVAATNNGNIIELFLMWNNPSPVVFKCTYFFLIEVLFSFSLGTIYTQVKQSFFCNTALERRYNYARRKFMKLVT